MLINLIYRLIFVVGMSQRQKLKDEPTLERGLGTPLRIRCWNR